jgi:hypothetical protein
MNEEMIREFRENVHLGYFYFADRGGRDAEVRYWCNLFPDIVEENRENCDYKWDKDWESRCDSSTADDLEQNAANNFFWNMRTKYLLTDDEINNYLYRASVNESPFDS